ncbi:5-hydroxytryptamine receptor-like isoform X1 [Onthophagus taurus]|uniref:5-hydroxytryptamine receptor-like isoform X1 n=2 Tax=Onthophagus taurus TaxID=166361 RepID=UPI0039BE89DF
MPLRVLKEVFDDVIEGVALQRDENATQGSQWNRTQRIPFVESFYEHESSLEQFYLNLTNLTNIANHTSNDTLLDGEGTEPLADLILMILLSILLGLMILVTVIGNVFVIAAILLERNLQNVANYLIVSLAVADLMVACLVMPLGAVYVISNNWIMGPELCDMWTSIDVLCCTASILHLVAIAMDRYWAVTNVVYTRNGTRIGVMIIMVWSVALVVSLAPQVPQFGWKDPDYLVRINNNQCMVSQDIGYQIFATSSTFYVPLLVIFVLYWKIFQTARKRIRKRREMKNQNLESSINVSNSTTNNNSNSSGGKITRNFLTKPKFLKTKRRKEKKSSKAAEALVASLVMMEGQSTTTTMETVDEHDEQHRINDQTTVEEETTAFTITTNINSKEKFSPERSTNNGRNIEKEIPVCPASVDKLIPSTRKEKKESIEAKRERKAAKTLAIITGAFVMCWLPFFVLALASPMCEGCINSYIMSFFLWLGYFNSTLNPVIYTIFNPEFRQAFKRILCGGGRSRSRNFRSGKIR